MPVLRIISNFTLLLSNTQERLIMLVGILLISGYGVLYTLAVRQINQSSDLS